VKDEYDVWHSTTTSIKVMPLYAAIHKSEGIVILKQPCLVHI
jgi:hypothetical protein